MQRNNSALHRIAIKTPPSFGFSVLGYAAESSWSTTVYCSPWLLNKMALTAILYKYWASIMTFPNHWMVKSRNVHSVGKLRYVLESETVSENKANSYTVIRRGTFSSICIIQQTTKYRWKFRIRTYTMIILCIVFPLYIIFVTCRWPTVTETCRRQHNK